MQLDRIQITNFRSIKYQVIKFDRNYQVLVGINESGKSNILKAISFLNENIKFNKNDIRDPSHDESAITESYIRFVFKYQLKEIDEIFNNLKNKILAKNYNKKLIDIGDKQYTLHEFCKYKSEVLYVVNLLKETRSNSHWKMEIVNHQIYSEWKKIKKIPNQEIEIDGNKFNTKDISIVNINDYNSFPAELLEDLDLNSLNSIIGDEFVEYFTDLIPECIIWNYNESNLLPGKVNLTNFITDPNICIPLKNMFNLAGFDDVTKSLKDAELKVNGIRNIFRKVTENTTTHMKKVWPEWNKLKVTIIQNGEFIEAGIEDEFNFYSLERRSDGFKRFFTFLLMISVQNKTEEIFGNIIVIDEPDIGLHPSGVQYLNEELKKIGKNNLVIISTHSIFMIDKEIVDRHLIVEKSKEITEIKRVELSNINDEEVIYKALGFSLFELLKTKNIIFEGWRDKNIFNTYIKSNVNKLPFDKNSVNNIGLLHAIGTKDIARIANLCENFNREYVIITDSDKPAKEKQKVFEGKGKWFCYNDIASIEAITTEDFIPTKLIEKATKECFALRNISHQIDFSDKANLNIIDYIKNELNKINEKKEENNILINEIKEYICENIKANDIHDNYLMVCETIIKELLDSK